MSAVGSKDAGGNIKLNVTTIKEHLSPEVTNCYSGNSSDHTNDARKPRETFKQLLAPDRLEHVVVLKPILICDLFHADNLAINHVSVAAFGDTERNNFR